MKKMLSLLLVAAVLATSLGCASVAYAEEAGADGYQGGGGTGILTAQGDGIAILGGRGTVDVAGNGILWVRDIGGGATIEVTGYGQKEEFNDGWVQYAGFHGDAHVEGARVVVVIAGVDIDMEAQGRGRFILWGHGTYDVGGRSGEWNTGRGVHMRLGGPSAVDAQ
ncbi:MAG: hypothetical protein SV910_08910 [Chloroflexota bacterium]|nr:hypothetical protein [Chloroflexota bacterium]